MKPINFSCADFTFPLLAREQSLSLIRLLDFSFVDIGLFARSNTFSPTDLVAGPAEYIAAVQRDMDRHGLRASDVFLQIGTEPSQSAANDPERTVRTRNREIFHVAVTFASALGCNHVTGLPGVLHEGIPNKVDWELAVEEAQWRLEACSRAGIQYAVEPHLGSICADIDSTLELLGSVPGLTLTLDYGHFIFNSTPPEHVHRLATYASHFHARCGAPGRLQTPMVENEIDFEGAIAALDQADYGGTIALEYVWIDWNQCNRCDNVSETILLRQYLSKRLGKC